MSTKIRLARHGRKGRPFYHVVIADSRAPRDGRYIEKIGTYNPNTNPATIDLKFDRALYWLMTGAQPTDTASRILSYKGVLLKKHLLEGVKKGAFDEAAAEAKFEAWMKEKEAKIQAKIQKLAQAGDAAAKAALEAEAKVRAAKEEIIAKKKAELAAAEAAKKAEEEALNKAKELIKKLDDGEDFATLAKDNSADEGTASEGGLFANFTKQGVVSEFFDAAYALKDNEYTKEPVKTTYVYHIILKISQNEKPSLDTVKDDIKDTLVTNKLDSDKKLSVTAWDEIRSKYNMSINDDKLKSNYTTIIDSYKK